MSINPGIYVQVSPGDLIAELPAQGQIKTGAGIVADGSHLQTLRAGVLRETKSGKLWVEGRQKRCGASPLLACCCMPDPSCALW